MVFLFILLILYILIITIKIRIKIVNFKFESSKKQHINNEYIFQIVIYTLQKIPIIKIDITNEKIKKLLENQKLRQKINQEKTNIIENRNQIDKEIIKGIKNIKLNVKELNLKILIGTENAALTAIIIPIISTAIAVFFQTKIKKYNEKQIFSIQPVYINQNLINIEISGIFEIKMIHIINTICIVKKKKRKGEKHERTSNRGSYDYSYE